MALKREGSSGRCFSEWRSVTSDVLQGSVLGHLLFVIYINDLEENIAGLISKFVDDTKIGGVVDSDEDCQRIQQDIDWRIGWRNGRWNLIRTNAR